MDKPELETLGYKPECDKCDDTGNVLKPRKDSAGVDWEPCPDCLEQPNSNAMIFTQVNGCIDAAERLLEQLVPKTEQVEGCIITLKSWQKNNLKHLQKALG